VCTAIKNATNGIKLCLSFSPGLKFEAVYFKNAPASGGLRSPGPLLGLRPWTPLLNTLIKHDTETTQCWGAVCTAIKNSINGIKLCLSFSPGLKFQAVYFKKMLKLLGDSVPRPSAGASPLDPTAE